MIRVKGAKEIKPKFLPTAIMFEGFKPITKEITIKFRKHSEVQISFIGNTFYKTYNWQIRIKM